VADDDTISNLKRLNSITPDEMEHIRVLMDLAEVKMGVVETDIEHMPEEVEPSWIEERWRSIFENLARMRNAYGECFECIEALTQLMRVVKNTPDDDPRPVSEALRTYSAIRNQQNQRREEEREARRRRRFS
jgi:hypothetical protein